MAGVYEWIEEGIELLASVPHMTWIMVVHDQHRQGVTL